MVTANLLQQNSARKASFFSFQPGFASVNTPEPTWSLPGTGVTEEPTAPPGQNCTYSVSYWLEHPERWTEQVSLGGITYTRQEADEILSSAIQDVYTELFRQLYIAYLNIHHGATWGNIENTLNEANQWLREYPPGSQLSQFNQQRGLQMAALLEDFNNGEIYPGPCLNQPPTQSATNNG